MTAKKILLISPIPTHPPTAGNRVRLLRLAQAMSDMGHELVLAHIEREPGDGEAMREYWGARYHPVRYPADRSFRPSLTRRVLKRLKLVNPYNYRLDDFYRSSVDAQLQTLAAQLMPDVVWVEYVFMSAALLNFPNSVVKVIDTHDVFTDRYQRFLAEGQKPQWFSTSASQELQGLKRADIVVAIQEMEAKFFRELGAQRVVTVGDFVPVVGAIDHSKQLDGRLLLVGSANSSNVHAANFFISQCLPLIQREIPNVELDIVGGMCSELNAVPGVHLRGRVDDLGLCYAQAQLVINPAQFGSGLKIKSMEALGYGRGLVATSIGGEGLESGWGSAIEIADSAQRFAARTVELLTQPERRRALEIRALEFANSTNLGNERALTSLLG